MSGRERRIAPRKECEIPFRFRVVAEEEAEQLEQSAAGYGSPPSESEVYSAKLEGEALNLSESGIYFTSAEKLSVGAELEIYLTLPRELTGRGLEDVKCTARVVHVEERADALRLGFGAVVDRFEPIVVTRNWAN